MIAWLLAVAGDFAETWPLLWHGWIAGWLIAVTLALPGVLVVAREQIFIGAAVAQASTVGVAAGMWLVAALPAASTRTQALRLDSGGSSPLDEALRADDLCDERVVVVYQDAADGAWLLDPRTATVTAIAGEAVFCRALPVDSGERLAVFRCTLRLENGAARIAVVRRRRARLDARAFEQAEDAGLDQAEHDDGECRWQQVGHQHVRPGHRRRPPGTVRASRPPSGASRPCPRR